MKRLAILGSTGSIGVSTLEIVAEHPGRFKVAALTAGRNLALLEEQIARFSPVMVAVPDRENARLLEERIGDNGPEVLYGNKGLISCAAESPAEMVVSAIVGAAGLEPTLAAIEAGRDIALANKESLVVGGDLVAAAVAEGGRQHRLVGHHLAAQPEVEVGHVAVHRRPDLGELQVELGQAQGRAAGHRGGANRAPESTVVGCDQHTAADDGFAVVSIGRVQGEITQAILGEVSGPADGAIDLAANTASIHGQVSSFQDHFCKTGKKK